MVYHVGKHLEDVVESDNKLVMFGVQVPGDQAGVLDVLAFANAKCEGLEPCAGTELRPVGLVRNCGYYAAVDAAAEKACRGHSEIDPVFKTPAYDVPYVFYDAFHVSAKVCRRACRKLGVSDKLAAAVHVVAGRELTNFFCNSHDAF